MRPNVGAAVARAADRYGWRALWLMVVGSAWLLIGLGTWVEGNNTPWVPLQQLPQWLVAIGWWITGGIAIGTGLRGRILDDSTGHVALYVMPAIKVLSWTTAWLLSAASPLLLSAGVVSEPIGYGRGWYAAAIWLATSAMLAVTAGWPNPSRIIPKPPATTSEGG